MRDTLSLTELAKAAAGVSLTDEAKKAAGRSTWLVDDISDTDEDVAEPGPESSWTGSLLAKVARACTVAALAFAFVLAGSLVFDAPRPAQSAAYRRVALVIGNAAYRHTRALSNPGNDAADISAALKRLGFHVIEGLDLDKAAFEGKLREFAGALQGADIGAFFYAGHGLQVSGANYLVPVDAHLSSTAALDFELVRLDLVQRTMEREAKTSILFFDACRDNPLARNLARAIGARSTDIGSGLAAVESSAGTLISFSTQPGRVALDGPGRNSPFSAALARQLQAPSDDLSAILIAVRNDVMKETLGRQVPWEHSALTGKFYFKPTAPAPGPGPIAASQGPGLVTSSISTEAHQAWTVIKDTTNLAVLEAFIESYGDTFYGKLARARISELKQLGVALPPSKAPHSPN